MNEAGIVVTDALGHEKPNMGDPLVVPNPAEFSEEVQQKMPVPTGYQILIALPKVDERTDSGNLIKAVQVLDDERVSSVVGFVLALGPDCYADEKRFPSGPYCVVGDFVIFHAYSGTRISIFGKEFRFINDDTVKAVVDDPRGIRRS